jgi:ATP-independent RNA helicase DbpA
MSYFRGMKHAHLHESLNNLGISQLNTMQEASISAMDKHKNVVLLSPTGSGKTIAFLLPLIARLQPNTNAVQALVLVPSRELALQIEDVFKRLRTGFKVTCCYGGHEVKIEANNLIEPPALLVGTPGRILDHLANERTDVGSARTLVIDEFDKCLDMGFTDEMAEIMSYLGRIEKKMFTSATPIDEMPLFVGAREVETLNFLSDAPVDNKLQVRRVNAFQTDKLDTLLALVGKLGEKSMLIFLNHRESVDRVSNYLSENGVINDIFHGGLEQKDRERTMTRFKNGSCRILVSTDLAARGLDIPAIDAVIHYHLPVNEEAYTHRNGRTARMNASGTAYVIVGLEEVLPDYIPDDLHYESLPTELTIPVPPKWVTLYIGKGKKDKVNKVDIVGFLCQQGNLDKNDIGQIDVKDFFCYVAVNREHGDRIAQSLNGKKLKNKSVKIELAY